MSAWEPFDWKGLPQRPIIGVDEVGRGCLAGPVYAAAAILDESQSLDGLTDSKLLSEKRREFLASRIQAHHQVSIGFATVEEIAEFNILRASWLAMKRAVEGLQLSSGLILVDGNMKIPGLETFEQITLIKGDLRAQPISAASIVAKVTRDRLMKDMAKEFPQYGFEQHKGYSTPTHKSAVEKWGPCVHHRRTFAGVKEHWTRLKGREVSL